MSKNTAANLAVARRGPMIDNFLREVVVALASGHIFRSSYPITPDSAKKLVEQARLLVDAVRTAEADAGE